MFTIIGGDGKEYGPATVEQLRGWIAAGRANLETKAKAAGSDEWRRLGDYPEFSGATAGLPPFAGAPATFATPATVPALPLARRFTRLASAILDNVIGIAFILPGIVLMAPGFVALAESGKDGGQPDFSILAGGAFAIGALVAMMGLLALIIIQIWMLVTRGQTMGKRLLGIRIVRYKDNAKPDFVHSVLLRGIVPGVLGAIPYIGSLFSIVNVCFIFGEERRCLHDLIAGTKVVEGQPPASISS